MLARTKYYALVFLILCAAGGVAFFVGNAAYRARSKTWDHPIPQQLPSQRSPHNYKDVLATLEAERLRLGSRFQAASTAERTALITEARTILTRSIYNDLFPAWYGTPWDFNGTSQTPQQGKIACGYFVTTVLRDAGWKVERVRLAQQASENIILSLTTDTHVKRFRRVAAGDFVNAVKDWGAGIYVVGLDVHVGFIVNIDGEVYFIHSSYVDPYAVVRERAIESRILASSNYRVLGNVLADDDFIGNWLAGKAISTKVTSGTRRTN